MSGFVVTTSSTVVGPLGPATLQPAQGRVTCSGQAVFRLGDSAVMLVPLPNGTTGFQPIQWTAPSRRVRVLGAPVILSSSVGWAGPHVVAIMAVQPRASAGS